MYVALLPQVIAPRVDALVALLGTLSTTQPEAKHIDEATRFPVEVESILGICRERNVFAPLPVMEGDEELEHLETLEFNEDFVQNAMMDSQTFTRGCVGGGLDSLEGAEGLSCSEFVELMARCGDAKYSSVHTMDLSKVSSLSTPPRPALPHPSLPRLAQPQWCHRALQRIAAFFANVFDAKTPEEEILALAHEKFVEPEFNAETEPYPEGDDWDDEQQAAWLFMWNQLDFSHIPDFNASVRSIFRSIREHRHVLLHLFTQFSRNKSGESSVLLDGWQRLFREAAAVTRSLNQKQIDTIFNTYAVMNKLDVLCLKFPHFLQVSMHPCHAVDQCSVGVSLGKPHLTFSDAGFRRGGLLA